MFNYSRVEDSVLKHDLITFLNSQNIDVTQINKNIRKNMENKGHLLDDVFSNRMFQMLSPNILLENVIFSESYKYLHKNNLHVEAHEIDIKSLIASQNSIIPRPQISKPNSTEKGFKHYLDEESEFIRIARYENELIKDKHGIHRKGQNVIFEGITIFGERMPFIHYLPSYLIWHNAYYYEPFVVGLIKKFNGFEFDHILWINSLLIQDLGLHLDNFNNGLRALNSADEVVLEYRQWKKDLIGNSIDSNIGRLEGCDLLLRKDYFEILKTYIPNLEFYTDKLEAMLPT